MESEVNAGTIFSFTILTDASSQSVRTYVTNSITGIEGKKVLVVDDNLTNRYILRNQLAMWKMIPTLASSGTDALEILAQGKSFDLVLTDMEMPDMDGRELATTIRVLYPQLPIILLSSVGDSDGHNKKYESLFNAVITKPIKQETLCKLMISALRGKTSAETQPVIKKLSTMFAKENPLRILVAEDNLINQKLALKILSKLGYEARLAQNGREVIEMANLREYDLIFMDVQMPEMDGIETTRMIRKYMEVQPLIIAMTANVMKEDRGECIGAGMNDFLSKPIKLEDLNKHALQMVQHFTTEESGCKKNRLISQPLP